LGGFVSVEIRQRTRPILLNKTETDLFLNAVLHEAIYKPMHRK